MKSVSVLICFALAIIVAVAGKHLPKSESSCSLERWGLFKREFGKHKLYADQEDQVRRGIFCKSLQAVERHNSNPNVTFKMGVNQFSDRTDEELRQLMGSLNANQLNFSQGSDDDAIVFRKLSEFIDLNQKPPAEVDWSLDASRVSPVKNQGRCGSCWAFATIGLLEGQEKPADLGKLVPLSEQNLVDCDEKNLGCYGGFYSHAFDEIRRNGGVMSQEDYPYVSGNTEHRGTCKMDRKKAFVTTLNLGETLQLVSGNETLLQQVVASYGPVAVAIQATKRFIAYENGTFYDRDCATRINHAVLVVGYGRDEKTKLDYWKIKNSWSTEWGQNGFGLMSRNRNNNCLIASFPFIVTPSNTTK